MKASSTKLYQSALNSLTNLKEQHGISTELKDLARFLLYISDCDVQHSVFGWQPTDTEIDKATAEALSQAWQDFIAGDDD